MTFADLCGKIEIIEPLRITKYISKSHKGEIIRNPTFDTTSLFYYKTISLQKPFRFQFFLICPRESEQILLPDPD